MPVDAPVGSAGLGAAERGAVRRAKGLGLPPYATASALALVVSCDFELAATSGPIDAVGLCILGCLCVVLGALQGLAWSLGLRALRPLPRWAQALVWCAAGAAVGASLAQGLGAFDRLQGPYRALALQVLAMSSLVGGAFALLTCQLQPTPSQPQGAVFRFGVHARSAFAIALTLAAALCFFIDRNYYVGLYVRFHDALRWGGWWAVMFAGVLVPEQLPLPKYSVRRSTAIVLLSAVLVPALAMIHPRGVATLMMRPWSASLVHVAQATLDFDRDGYAALLGGGDCDEWNPAVNPGAREIPGNGIDDNCMLGDAKPLPPPPPLLPAPRTPSPYDVVLITVDSFRPDHLGLYNPAYGPRGRRTTPNLDAWANSAVVFEHAYAPGGWTSIALPSIMRGLFPRRLDWTRYFETTQARLLRKPAIARLPNGEWSRQMFPLAFEDTHPTLASLLHRRGMRTAAVVHDGFSRMLTHGVGVERDFDDFWEVETWERAHEDDSGTADLAMRELARVPRSQPLFMWVHFFGPHSPNQLHPGTPIYGPTLIDGYDHEIHYFDEQLPALWAAIERRGRPTVVALTGDHGEVFEQIARMHGFSISEQDIRVPLLLHVPGYQPRRVQQLVSTIDLFPTLLALTQTPGPAGDGVDLAPWATGSAATTPRKLISETWRYEPDGSPVVDFIAAFDGQKKVVLNTVDHSFRSYEQQAPSERPSWVDTGKPGALTSFLLQYVEQTGGALAPHD